MQSFAWLPTHTPLRYAAIAALVLAVVTVAILLQVLVVSALAERGRRRRAAFNEKWRPELARASIGADTSPALPPPRGRQRVWWLMLWNRMQRQLRGESNQRLNAVIDRLGMEAHAVRLLGRPGVRSRLVALETLRHIGRAAHWRTVAPYLGAGNAFIALAAAQALIAMDAPRAMRALLPVLLARDDFGAQRAAVLARQAGRDAVTPSLLAALDGASATTLDRLIPLLPHAHPDRVAPWARACLATDADPRHRLAAVQALGELGNPGDHALLVATLGDDDAGVRLAAVTALRRQAREADVERLLPLLGDPSWWVRRQVADTLVALPRFDVGRLEALLPRLPDRYGRDALQRALAEHAARGASP